VTAFGRVIASRATVAAARAEVDTAREDLRTAEARRDAGAETEANVLAFRVRLAEAGARAVRADQDAIVARASLNAAIGAPLDDERAIADMPPGAVREVNPAALEAQALRSRPELAQAAARRDQSAAGQLAARASLLPWLAVQAGAERNSNTVWNGASSWSAGVQARWNLFAGGGDVARIRQAGAAARRSRAEYERIETALRLEVRSAAAAYQSAAAREAAGRQIVEQARESQRMIRDRYEAGLSQAADVLRAAELVAHAEAERTAALMEVQVTAAALDRAVGSRQTAAGDTQRKTEER
jgi:outer membrane protein TolC